MRKISGEHPSHQASHLTSHQASRHAGRVGFGHLVAVASASVLMGQNALAQSQVSPQAGAKAQAEQAAGADTAPSAAGPNPYARAVRLSEAERLGLNTDLSSTLDTVAESARLVDTETGAYDVENEYLRLIAQQSNPFAGSSGRSGSSPARQPAGQTTEGVGGDSGEAVDLGADDEITLNFQDADISALINLVAKVTGRNFIIDPRVKGKVTLVSGRPVPAETLYDIFLSVLATYNFAAVPSGNLIKIIPSNLVKQLPTPTITDEPLPTNEQEVTYIVTLEHASVNELLPIIRPLLPPTAHVAPHAGSNTLILTDRATNIARVLSLIQRMDKQQKGQDIRVIYLKYADAKQVSQVISQIAGTIQSSEAAKGLPVEQTLVQVDEGLNALIIRAPEKDFPVLEGLIAQLDVERLEKGNVHVKHLNFAQAKEMVDILNGIIQDRQGTAGQEGAAPVLPISIQADEANNALVVRAEPDDYEELLTIIEELDVRRRQVFVEAIIAEVSVTDQAALGINWTGTSRNRDHSEITGSSGFSDTGGMEFGFINKYVRDLSGAVVPDLNIVLNALRSDSNSNIISTPNLLTLDNEEAEIVVGQEVPFVTGRYTSSNSNSTNSSGDSSSDNSSNTSGTVNPFQTIERKEVGMSLKITPQINEGGAIHLDIAQEISSVNPVTLEGAADLITDKRTISAKVLVDDQQIIVLGGLIRDDMTDTYERIPVLGDLPLVGAAFRKKKKEASKTNLMVFLRPTIVQKPADLDVLTQDRYEYLRTEEAESLPDTRKLLKQRPPQLPSYKWHEETYGR